MTCLAGASSLAVIAAFVLHAASARAEPEAFECRTATSRPAAEIIVPFASEGEPGLPAFAVRLLPGETLCLGGRLAPTGELMDLTLLEGRRVDGGPVISLELDRSDHTKLVVQHSDSRNLVYRAAAVVTRQYLGLPTSTLPVAPGVVGHEIWGPNVRELLLFSFRFVRPREGDTHGPLEVPTRLPSAEPRKLAAFFGLWIGERTVSLPALDTALISDGFAPLPHTRVVGGLDLDFHLWRARVGVSIGGGAATTRHQTSGADLTARHGEIGFTAGFDVVRYDNFTVFASAGFLISNLFLDARTPGFTLFANQLQPWERPRVRFSHGLVPLELGYEYLAPLGRASATEYWALQFGARAGPLVQTGGRWEIDDERNARSISGPDLDLSGFRYRLVLGIGAYDARR